MASRELTEADVVIAVFVMPECGACEGYMPKLRAAVRRAGRPFYIYPGHGVVPKGAIPVLFYDVSKPDDEVQAFATRIGVEATPTTAVLPRGEGVFKVEGDLADNQIDYVLASARSMHRK